MKQFADSRAVLSSFGATPNEVEELQQYNENRFDVLTRRHLEFPLGDEPFVEAWEAYAFEAAAAGGMTTLLHRLSTRSYSVTQPAGGGLHLLAPDLCRLNIHQTPAGKIPVIVASGRSDFVTLFRFFAGKSAQDPAKPVPASMGAAMISGYVNYDRIRRLHERHAAAGQDSSSWSTQLQIIKRNKELYQDRLILLCPGRYSGVEAGSLGLEEKQWPALSLRIRLEHEGTHYFTRRVFGSMQNRLLDELMADYCGIESAAGAYQAAWALHFLGIEVQGQYRQGGRLENYANSLTPGAFQVLQQMVRAAIHNLAMLSEASAPWRDAPAYRIATLFSMASCTLEALASPEGGSFLSLAFSNYRELFDGVGKTA